MDRQDHIVFIVDDDPRVRESLSELLSSADLHAVSFGSASDFLAYPNPDLPCCLVLDVDLPDINGLELLSFLKKHPDYCTIPVVIISTEKSEGDLNRGLALGADHYLMKPFAPHEL